MVDADRPAAGHTIQDADALRQVITRLKRAQGQIGGVIAMMEDGRSCEDVVTQLAAVSKAVDRAGFTLIATGLRECLAEADGDMDDVVARLQKLFLALA